MDDSERRRTIDPERATRRTESEGETGDETADDEVTITVRAEGTETTIQVPGGTRLRDALLSAGLSPYGTVSRATNCGGRGLCGTCGVRIDPAPEPRQWHDSAAERFGYPRLSCQITVEEPLTVEVPKKIVWGQLLPDFDR